MPEDKIDSRSSSMLEIYAKRLCNIATKSSEARLTSSEDNSKLQSLNVQLNKILSEYELLLSKKNRPIHTPEKVEKPSFSRSKFYHKEQPWDKSHSFRLAPPPVTKPSSRIKASQRLQQSDARLLLSNLPLLQNLKNLQHLNNAPDRRDGS